MPNSPTVCDGNGSTAQRMEALREQVRRIRCQKNELMRDVIDLQQQKEHLSEIFKRSLFHMMSLLKPYANPQMGKALDALKDRLVTDPDWSTVEGDIQHMKTLSLQELCDAGSAADPGRASETLKTSDSPSRLLPEFLNAHRMLMDSLRCDFGEAYRQSWESVSHHLDTCRSFDDLLVGTRRVADLARQLNDSVTTERSRVARFFTEIGQDLVEMESMVHATARHNQETKQANDVFHAAIDGQMKEMHDSVNLIRTLEELKTVVESKLATIKRFLREKREQDEARHRSSGQNTESLQQVLKKMKHEISNMREKTRLLEEQAVRDSLTGIHNRRAFDARLLEEFHRFRRYGQGFSLLMIDLDHFKHVNDAYGHTTGDQCLKEVTRRIGAVLRKPDFFARYGGEEFAVILPGVSKDAALAVAEKLRLCVEKTRFLYEGQRIPLTISVGVAETQANDDSPQGLFERADAALYQAKKQGRNCVVAS